ncbi:MAG: hypothetical protein IJ618_04570 [Prevotella sp.]|nr:hypothetical protein [Prevotella sp.]
MSRRHLRPEAIIPYPGWRLSVRGVTTIGTTRRDYQHDLRSALPLGSSKNPQKACPCFDAVKEYAAI